MSVQVSVTVSFIAPSGTEARNLIKEMNVPAGSSIQAIVHEELADLSGIVQEDGSIMSHVDIATQATEAMVATAPPEPEEAAEEQPVE
jgi:hypothetical protein